jgi:hypothetical protein
MQVVPGYPQTVEVKTGCADIAGFNFGEDFPAPWKPPDEAISPGFLALSKLVDYIVNTLKKAFVTGTSV